MWGGWLWPRQGGRGPEGTPMPYLQWLSESVSEGDGTFIRMLAPLDEQQAAESVATAGARTPPLPYTPGAAPSEHGTPKPQFPTTRTPPALYARQPAGSSPNNKVTPPLPADATATKKSAWLTSWWPSVGARPAAKPTQDADPVSDGEQPEPLDASKRAKDRSKPTAGGDPMPSTAIPVVTTAGGSPVAPEPDAYGSERRGSSPDAITLAGSMSQSASSSPFRSGDLMPSTTTAGGSPRAPQPVAHGNERPGGSPDAAALAGSLSLSASSPPFRGEPERRATLAPMPTAPESQLYRRHAAALRAAAAAALCVAAAANKPPGDGKELVLDTVCDRVDKAKGTWNLTSGWLSWLSGDSEAGLKKRRAAVKELYFPHLGMLPESEWIVAFVDMKIRELDAIAMATVAAALSLAVATGRLPRLQTVCFAATLVVACRASLCQDHLLRLFSEGPFFTRCFLLKDGPRQKGGASTVVSSSSSGSSLSSETDAAPRPVLITGEEKIRMYLKWYHFVHSEASWGLPWSDRLMALLSGLEFSKTRLAEFFEKGRKLARYEYPKDTKTDMALRIADSAAFVASAVAPHMQRWNTALQLVGQVATLSRISPFLIGSCVLSSDVREALADIVALMGSPHLTQVSSVPSTQLAVGLYYFLVYRRAERGNHPLTAFHEHQVDAPGVVMPDVPEDYLDLLKFHAPLAKIVYEELSADVQRLGDMFGYTLLHYEPVHLARHPSYAMFARNKEVFLVVRGTKHVADILIDGCSSPAKLVLKHTGPARNEPREFRLHKGMLRSAQWLFTRLWLPVAFLMDKGYTMRVIGHSLGAGVGVILTAIMRDEGLAPDLKCVAFSMPSCGDRAFAEYAENFCVSAINGDDLVPRIRITSLRNLMSAVADPILQARAHHDLSADTTGVLKRLATVWAPRMRSEKKRRRRAAKRLATREKPAAEDADQRDADYDLVVKAAIGPQQAELLTSEGEARESEEDSAVPSNPASGNSATRQPPAVGYAALAHVGSVASDVIMTHGDSSSDSEDADAPTFHYHMVKRGISLLNTTLADIEAGNFERDVVVDGVTTRGDRWYVSLLLSVAATEKADETNKPKKPANWFHADYDRKPLVTALGEVLMREAITVYVLALSGAGHHVTLKRTHGVKRLRAFCHSMFGIEDAVLVCDAAFTGQQDAALHEMRDYHDLNQSFGLDPDEVEYRLPSFTVFVIPRDHYCPDLFVARLKFSEPGEVAVDVGLLQLDFRAVTLKTIAGFIAAKAGRTDPRSVEICLVDDRTGIEFNVSQDTGWRTNLYDLNLRSGCTILARDAWGARLAGRATAPRVLMEEGDDDNTCEFWPPGEIVHLYSTCGVAKAALLRPWARAIERIEVGSKMVDDHRMDAVLASLRAVTMCRRNKVPVRAWEPFSSSSACACCHNDFAWMATTNSKAAVSQLRSRAHCHHCGKVVCTECRQRALASSRSPHPSPICDACYFKVATF